MRRKVSGWSAFHAFIITGSNEASKTFSTGGDRFVNDCPKLGFKGDAGLMTVE